MGSGGWMDGVMGMDRQWRWLVVDGGMEGWAMGDGWVGGGDGWMGGGGWRDGWWG